MIKTLLFVIIVFYVICQIIIDYILLKKFGFEYKDGYENNVERIIWNFSGNLILRRNSNCNKINKFDYCNLEYYRKYE